MAIGVGIVTGSVSLVAFGADSFIEVISAVALLWRLRKAGPHASAEKRGAAERRALYIVAATFFLLASYIAYEAVGALLSREGQRVTERHRVGLKGVKGGFEGGTGKAFGSFPAYLCAQPQPLVQNRSLA